MRSRELLRLQLRRDRSAAAGARRALERAALPGDRRTASLLTTELVNNAVLHGSGEEISLTVTRAPGRLRVEVTDDGDGFDPRRLTEREDPGGWGLEMVGALAHRWGMYEGSTHVWFELTL